MAETREKPLRAGVNPSSGAERAWEKLFSEEQDRLALWLPVFLGVGIGVYFALPSEPGWWMGTLLVVATGGLMAAARLVSPSGLGRVAAGALIATALGFAAAQVRTASVAAPVLEQKTSPVSLSGRIVLVETLPAGEGARITLDRIRSSLIAPERTPEYVRVRLKRPPAEPLVPGDWISARAVLSPPPAPSAPGAFDFQRHAYFRSLGAVGFVIGGVTRIARAEDGPGGEGEFWRGLERLRQDLTLRIQTALPGATGAVAAALMTGDRSAIPASLNAAMRDSGLAHLLSISGLHVGLVAAILFVGLRAALALVPPLALKFSIKKWAAAAAIPGTLAYAVLSGMAAPTQRSVIMVGLVMVAVLADRRALTMRTLAWAAAAILLVQPESLLNPGFQMSFAAVAALIAAYEWKGEFQKSPEDSGWARNLFGVFVAVALSSLVATAATTPYAVYHFNRFAVYGLAANMIAVPLTSFWIMPWAVLAFALMPFGLEALALGPMGVGVEAVNAVAEAVADWPGAGILAPAMPLWGLVLATVGGLWLCLMRRRWRLAGVPVVIAGLASAVLTAPPDVLVDGEGRLLAVRTAEGSLAISAPKGSRLSRDTWLRLSGVEEGEAAPWPRPGEADDAGRLRCDHMGCVVRAHGRAVARVRDRGALIEDCARAELVVSTVPTKRLCAGAQAVIDRSDLRAKGAHAIWIGADGITVKAVNDARGNRPWVLRPPERYPGRLPTTTPPTPEGEDDDGDE
ncbi:MAG: ComEC/Rec2 family competence protein [Pseudomonadota bacterium]